MVEPPLNAASKCPKSVSLLDFEVWGDQEVLESLELDKKSDNLVICFWMVNSR